jgi:hypothetical protein
MPRVWRRRIRLPLLVAVVLASSGSAAFADAGWFESGDAQMRTDLQLLNDAEIFRLPLNQWPLPRAAVRYALANAKEAFATNSAVQAALERVRRRAQAPESWRFSAFAGGGGPGLLRDFDALGRDDGEIGGRVDYSRERFEVSLNATALLDPADEQEAKLDGSHATLQLGNWLLSLHSLERWWGPGREGSLILSNNARPMPTAMVERAVPIPFQSRWLSWLGPWRFSFAISQMENERRDIDRPLFMAWRVAIMPLKDVELGFSRTAQFCGRQLACTLDTFGNMLAGNDNVGIDATPENEPGNQMAGFDLRWSSPIGSGPYAIYGQAIGEDESSYLPAKYLTQFGLETWKPFTDGALLQGFAEWANTTCSGISSSGPYYNCAYNQGRFDVEGYRYRGRSIGHTTDSDAESYALGAIFTSARGETWSATARASRLNYDGVDTRNTLSPVASDYAALELGWRGTLFGESVSVDLGVEALEPSDDDRVVEPFGFVSWRHQF